MRVLRQTGNGPMHKHSVLSFMYREQAPLVSACLIIVKHPSLQSHPVQQRLQLRQFGFLRLKTKTGAPVNSPSGREKIFFPVGRSFGPTANRQTAHRLALQLFLGEHQPSRRVQLTALLALRQSRWPVRAAVRRSPRRSPLSLLSQRLIPVVKFHSCGTQHMLFPQRAGTLTGLLVSQFRRPFESSQQPLGIPQSQYRARAAFVTAMRQSQKANGADRLEHVSSYPRVC